MSVRPARESQVDDDPAPAKRDASEPRVKDASVPRGDASDGVSDASVSSDDGAIEDPVSGDAEISTATDAGVPIADLIAEQQSGSRLQARYLTTPEGGREFVEWYDTQRNTVCQIKTAADGVPRCLPIAAGAGTSFSDPLCQQGMSSIPPGVWGVEALYSDDRSECEIKRTIYERDQARPTALRSDRRGAADYYYRTNGTCSGPYKSQASYKTMRADPRFAPRSSSPSKNERTTWERTACRALLRRGRESGLRAHRGQRARLHLLLLLPRHRYHLPLPSFHVRHRERRRLSR
jgi:hypothetical protein